MLKQETKWQQEETAYSVDYSQPLLIGWQVDEPCKKADEQQELYSNKEQSDKQRNGALSGASRACRLFWLQWCSATSRTMPLLYSWCRWEDRINGDGWCSERTLPLLEW